MAQATLDILSLVLERLTTTHKADLQLTKTGSVYLTALEEKRAALSSLPPGLLGMPVAQELKGTDELHDALRLALELNIRSHLECPLTPEHTRKLLQEGADKLEALLPGKRASYPAEAAAAKRLREAQPSLQPALEQIPVAGGTLADWLDAMIEQGERLDALLSTRGDTLSTSDRAQAAALRGEIAGLLSRLRAALRDELAFDPSLPQDLEKRLFAYYDSLLAARRPSSKPAAPVES
ncbi:MAG: hypothetical protein RBU37_25025 [Myxococcota bacterium]|jgi:hypothetical protein|nr:hypothetical protein [Myxococcota bacterium]